MSVFTKVTQLVVLLAIGQNLQADTTLPLLPNGIASGDTTSHSTVLWARRAEPGSLLFQVAADRRFNSLVFEQVVAIADPLLPAKVQVDGLASGQRYFYRVDTVDGGKLVGRFRTAAETNGSSPLRFGVSGDWRGELKPYPAITNAAQRGLEFFVKLGDTIYADYPSPDVPKAQAETIEEFRLKHNEVYSTSLGLNAFADLQASTSVFSTIDDHEVTNDFAGGAPASSDARFTETTGLINETVLYRNGLQVFDEYNPILSLTYNTPGDSRMDGRPDLYRYQRYGTLAAVYVLDARSFRDEELPEPVDVLDLEVVADFLQQSFDPSRTMLGETQLLRLMGDLLDAKARGVVWKFVMMPEPIQNLGMVLAPDRYEGYAAERTRLLQFIDQQDIGNVVFVSADIHGSIVNNLNYRTSPDGPEIETDAFEITTGAVAFDAPFGPTVREVMEQMEVAPGLSLFELFLKLQGLPDAAAFDQLSMAEKDKVMERMINLQLSLYGYNKIGLQDSKRIKAVLARGGYTAVHNYGWSEFQIDPDSMLLRISTFGIEAYDEQAVGEDILQLEPQLISRFYVRPR